MNSVSEQILARIKSVLNGATAAGANVERGRDDAWSPEECPALNIRRADGQNDPLGRGAERVLQQFDVDVFARGNGWETDADALHMSAHALLMADAPLSAMGKGLRCTGTTLQSDSADAPLGRLTARYQIQIAVRPGDYTRKLNP
jgi:hypothetical protein